MSSRKLVTLACLFLTAMAATAQDASDAVAPPILPPGSLRFLASAQPSMVNKWRSAADRQSRDAGELLALRAAVDVAFRSDAFCPPGDVHCQFIVESTKLIQRPARPAASSPQVADDLGRVTHALAYAVRRRMKISLDDVVELRKAVSPPKAAGANPVRPAAAEPSSAPPPATPDAVVETNGIEEATRLVTAAIRRVPSLASDATFKNLPVTTQAAVIRGLAQVRQPTAAAADVAKVDSRVLYEQFGVVSQRWAGVVASHVTLLKNANETMIATEKSLAAAQDSLDSQRVQLDDLAERIAHSKDDVSEQLRGKFFTTYAKLTRDTAAYRGMLSGIVPPQLVAGNANTFNADVVAAAAQLATSGDQNARLVSGLAQAAAGDLGSAVAALTNSGANVEAFGISVPAESLISIAQGGDPITALAGPVLTSVGLPPELGTLAVGLSTGNVFAAVGAFASLGGLSFGGGGGSSSDPAVAAALGQIQEQLGQIRQSLARIESRLDKIDAKLDSIERQMQANHAAVMARLEVIGGQLVAINALALKTLQSNVTQCNQEWLVKYRYEQLRDLLNSSKVDDYRECFQALKRTLSEGADLNPAFLLSVTEQDPYAKTPLVKSYYAPHYDFLRASVATSPDARQKAATLLGAGDNSTASLAERLRGLEPAAPVPSRDIMVDDILRPERIVAADAVDKFVSKVLTATSLRPFINLSAKSKMVTLGCAGQQSCLSDNQAEYANPIEIEDLLHRTIRLVDTGVAQASILDGDLALQHAVDVITADCGNNDTCTDEQKLLNQIMEMNEVYAKNVAHLLLRKLFEIKYGTRTPAAAQGTFDSRWSAADAYLYSFAFAAGSPQMLSRVFEQKDDPRWNAVRFFRRDEAEGVSCTKLWEGEGLYVRMRNGVCVGLPEPVAFARGELAISREAQILQRARTTLVRELVTYSARRNEAVPARQRALLDRAILRP